MFFWDDIYLSMCFSKCHLALASVVSMSISLDSLNNFGISLTYCMCLPPAYPLLLYVLSSSQPWQTFFDMVLFLLDKLKWNCEHCGHTFHLQTFVEQQKLCLSLTKFLAEMSMLTARTIALAYNIFVCMINTVLRL